MIPLKNEEMPEAIDMAIKAGKTKPLTRDRKLEQLRLQTIADRHPWNKATALKVYEAFTTLFPVKKVWSKKRAEAEIKKHFKFGDPVSIGPFDLTYKVPCYGIVIRVEKQYVSVMVVEKRGNFNLSETLIAQAWDLRKMKEVNE